jgi:hypothetical protein
MIGKIIAGGLDQNSSGIDVSITVEFFCVKSKIRHETMWFQRRVLHLIHFRTTSFCTINLSFRFMVLLCVRGSNFKLPIVQQLINSWSNKDVKNVLVQRTSVAWTTISFRWDHCQPLPENINYIHGIILPWTFTRWTRMPRSRSPRVDCCLRIIKWVCVTVQLCRWRST